MPAGKEGEVNQLSTHAVTQLLRLWSMLHVVRPDKTPNKPAEEPAPTPAAPAAPAAAAAAGGKKVAGKAGGKKAAAKPITEAMTEDIIPALKTALGKEDGVSSLELTFADNTVSARRGSAPVQALSKTGSCLHHLHSGGGAVALVTSFRACSPRGTWGFPWWAIELPQRQFRIFLLLPSCSPACPCCARVQLCGSFIKDNIPFSFWAFFPDGSLDGESTQCYGA